MEPEALDLWAKKKGLDLMATGDLTHPIYVEELREKLVEDGSGLLQLKNVRTNEHKNITKFVLSGEISCIYKDKDKTRRIHLCILMPDFKSVLRLQKELEKRKCNIRSDGRPIVGLSAKQITEICLSISDKSLIIPAHIWTPWFSLFGSKSGYDKIEDCFEELTPNIYAYETGLSSNPPMNWRLSQLDTLTMLSNSDAHSPANIGRESNVFEFEKLTYDELFNALKTKTGLLYTINFFPEEGRYHYDGHAKCKHSCTPKESKAQKDICPKCKKPLVLGVDHRVDELADRELGAKSEGEVDYKSLVPLQELIAEGFGQGKNTKAVQTMYEDMIEKGKSEFNVLLELNREEIKNISNEIIAEAIMRVREGRVIKTPGYDGEYGIIKVFSEKEREEMSPNQKKLF
jgi:uncharacterized protein (TIGR00375 family)